MIPILFSKLFNSRSVPLFHWFFLSYKNLLDLSVSQVALTKFEIFKLFWQRSKALLSEESVWFEKVRLPNKEMSSLYFWVSLHFPFKELDKVTDELRP